MAKVLVSIIDITELKRIEEALRRSEETARALLNAPTDAVWILLDRDNIILATNEETAQRFQTSVDELIGTNAFDQFPPELEKLRRLFLNEVIETGKPLRFEDEWAGRYQDFQIYPIFDTDGNVCRVAVFAHDITDRKRAEKLLKESEEKYRLLVEHANEGIVVAQDGVLKLTNPKMSEILGYTADELVSRPFVEFFHPEDREMVMQHHIERLKGKETPSVYNLRAITKKGNLKWLENNGVTIHWEGEPATLKFLTDITERKKAEENLLTYQAQLRSLASELSLAEERERRLLATQLHDGIGQSLAVTKVKLGALKKAVAGHELIQSLNEIQEIIEQTIQITRTLTFDLSPPILYELGFEPAVEWLTDQIQERHGIRTTCEDDMKPKPLHDDIRVVLFQAVRELLVNVVKHAKARHINVSLSREDNSIRIHVRDDGMGFDTSKLNIHNGSTCGFGLFSIRERLDLLGGRLELQSEVGHGTRVSMIAPLKQKHYELQ